MIKHQININLVKQLMQKRGIDIIKLAKIMNLTQTTVTNLLKSSYEGYVSIINAFNIARALNVSMTLLINIA